VTDKASDLTKMTIYPFQADDIRVPNTPAEIAEWEDWMANRARVAGFDASRFKVGTRSTSCCGGTCDDCDFLQQ
jgi:hypothetical protein